MTQPTADEPVDRQSRRAFPLTFGLGAISVAWLPAVVAAAVVPGFVPVFDRMAATGDLPASAGWCSRWGGWGSGRLWPQPWRWWPR